DKSESPDSKQNYASSRQTEIKFVEKFFKEEANNYLIRAHAPTAMARLLKDAPPELKEGVAKQLVAALGKQSKERDEVRWGCVLALGQIGDTDKDKIDVEIREALKAAAEESHGPQQKNFAMISAGKVGGHTGTGEDNEKGATDCRNELLTTMTKGKTQVRPWAGLGIGVMEREILDGGQTPSASAKEQVRTSLKD